MKKKRNILSIISLITLALFVVSCNKSQGKQGAAPKNQAMPFPVIKVEKRNITTHKSYPAKLQGEVSSEVRAKVSGYITELLVDEGDRVKKDQLLFKLETQSLNQDAAAAKANVNAAQVEVDKLKPLVEKNIISSVQLETAKAKLAQAKSNLNSIQANIGYANIKSPVDGIVGSINFRKGALVSGQDPKPLTTVSSIGKVYAYFSMNEKDFLDFIGETGTTDKQLKELPKVSLLLSNGKKYEEKGSIETVSGNIDPETGTVTFRAGFKNPKGILRDGASGKIQVPQTYKDVIVIPTQSTYERQGRKLTYKVIKDSLVTQPISVITETDKLYVVEGLEEGVTILGKGINKVRPGTKIKPIPTPMDSIVNSFDTVFK